MKLSIVIPIFGVEKYIEKCLMSCVKQDLLLGEDYEIICVNDGTKDRSAIIAREIANSHKGITVIDQENGGLSSARNTGLAHAQGEYVWFVDSDDWIEPNSLSCIFPKLKDSVDILHINYQFVYDNKPPMKGVDCAISGIIDIIDGRTQILSKHYESPAPYSIYRREFLVQNKLKFCVGILHEDAEFKPRAILLAKKICFCDAVCYNYYQRDGSIMHSYKLRNVQDMLVVLNSLMSFVSTYDYQVRAAIYFKMSILLNNIIAGYNILNQDEKTETIKLLKKNKHIFYLMLHTGSCRYFFEGLALLTNVRLTLWLYNIVFNYRR